jgi:peroxiredoxin
MNTQYPIIGNYAPDFELLGTDNNVHHLRHYLTQFQAVAVVFIDNNNNQMENYFIKLQQLQTEFENQGLLVICINSQNKLEEMKEFVKKYQLNFPYLRDSNRDVAMSFEVMMKPEVFLIDSHGIIRYRGQIFDNTEPQNSRVGNYLRDNIKALLR